MTSREVISYLSSKIDKDTSIVSSLGRTSQEVYNVLPNQTLFLDSMGDIVSISCGIALGLENKPVIAIDTDGSNLMGISILSLISSIKERIHNLSIIVINNKILESGGGIETTVNDLKWEYLGKAWDINIVEVNTLDDLKKNFEAFAFKELTYFVVNVDNTSLLQSDSTKSIDGIESKYIFSRHLEKVRKEKFIKPCLKN
ncbi:thiamine pyrophosphate-dependent enzyme [Chryseobacterium shigense]|uniref:Thiamine pyrophosphate-dependent acetolactate synthase large subunit-like protein n=1 Tax=Chryseobacterium shigense TaxID=297244 RepID=A0A841NN32_9FLAO|nr:thiamine pyrophosphate-dependent enzyme [Chryseobacterium shigense]MBB6372629.1 thiamine pyrophosphate-dependent acetolactate synthase large subunit-like protein [Chryseobacterium shigense]